MRIKKSILKKKCFASLKRPGPDMDPTTNLHLHLEIWEKLREKIADEFRKR
jgi:hypothetical protein